jgi:hypothetical protein
MVSTFKTPPNSSTDGAKMITLSKRNSPYFFSSRLASSADLNVKEYPLSERKRKRVLYVHYPKTANN